LLDKLFGLLEWCVGDIRTALTIVFCSYDLFTLRISRCCGCNLFFCSFCL